MSNQKYTPGPWSATHINGSWWIEDDDPTAFCRRRIAIVDDGAGIESPEANARLIAAAPEMLAALEAANRFITNGLEYGYIDLAEEDTSGMHTIDAIRQAIRKTKGGSK